MRCNLGNAERDRSITATRARNGVAVCGKTDDFLKESLGKRLLIVT